ncbi:MAG TPA: hypothetical protein VMU51_09340 [Mycobacteriales bacterium]|nr:hypothetical protein [Mycobacteriales bacterium]
MVTELPVRPALRARLTRGGRAGLGRVGLGQAGLRRRVVQLYVGLVLYGLGVSLQVRAALGLDPWDVLHQGLAEHTGLRFGTVVIAVGVVVLLLWIPIRQRPGFGTVSNVIVIGLVLDVALAVLPVPHGWPLRWAFLLLGVLVGGLATGCYIAAGLGPGPRDGLMTGYARRTGRSIRLVRTTIELTVLVIGFLLGGAVGPGTVIYALAIGPLAQVFLRVLAIPGPASPGRGSSGRGSSGE